jgi:hypothetical protein
MQVATLGGLSVDQATRSSPMFGVVLKNPSCFDGFQGLIQTDGLFHHFLVGVSRQPQLPCQCLLA